MRYLIVIIILLFFSETSFGQPTFHIQDSFQIVGGDSITRFYKTYKVDKLGDTVFQMSTKKYPLNVGNNPNSNSIETWNVPGVGAYGEFTVPFNSTEHMNTTLAAIISCIFILFTFYIIYRVNKALKKDHEKK